MFLKYIKFLDFSHIKKAKSDHNKGRPKFENLEHFFSNIGNLS